MESNFFEFTLTHKSQKEAAHVEEHESLYYRDVHLDNDHPFIIDGGAHIGLTSLYLKHIYPKANIIAFEPNPYTFEILRKNVLDNGLSVNCINAALGKETGEVKLYGEHKDFTLGNTIIKSWTDGGEQDIEPLIVDCVKLSDYITQEVDLLKLNIEAAEKDVLDELYLANKLKLIKNIDLELHICKQTTNYLYDIKKLLTDNGFSFEINQKLILTPEGVAEHRKPWVEKNKPVILGTFAKNSIYEQNPEVEESIPA